MVRDKRRGIFGIDHSDTGVAFLERGQDGAFAEALSKFEQALRLDPRHEPAFVK